MNNEAAANLGQIVIGLTDQVSFVRIGKAESVLSKGLYTIKATRVHNGVTYEVTEMVSELALSEINDPMVIVDALITKMKDSSGNPMPRRKV